MPVALAFAVLAGGGTATDIGLVLGARAVPAIALVLVGGVVADRLSRVRIMAVTQLVRCASQVALGVAVVTGAASLGVFIAAQLVAGTSAAFFRPAAQAIVPTVVRSADEVRPANALVEAARSISTVVGPASAGVLVAALDPGWLLIADGVTFLISASLLLGGLGSSPTAVAADEDGVPRDFRRELVAGWDAIRRYDWMLSIMWFNAGFQFTGVAAFSVLGPVVAQEHLGGSAAWGAIGAASGAGGLAAGVLLMRVEPRRPLRAAYLALLGTLPLLVVLGLGAPVLVAVIASAVWGFALVAAAVLSLSCVQRLVPAALQSRVLSYSGFGAAALFPLGLALVGPAADWLGAEAVLFGAAGAVGLMVVVALRIPGVRSVGLGVHLGVACPDQRPAPSSSSENLTKVRKEHTWV